MKKTLALILAVVMTVALVACGGGGGTTSSAGSTSEPKQGTDIKDVQQGGPTDIQQGVEYVEDLIIAMDNKATSSDPQVGSNVHHVTIFNMNYNQLIEYDWVNQTFKPELATEWSVSDDGLTWTFKLRQDVVFHNGEKMTADDVVFTFERALATGTSGASTYKKIESVTANGDYEVSMKLKAADADWLFNLRQAPCSILNREAVEKDPDKGYEIGTGGWKLDSWVSGDYNLYTRFDESWVWIDNPLTPTKSIKFVTMSESSARAVATQTGEVHMNNNVEMIDVPVLKADANLKTEVLNADLIEFIGFNNEKGPTTDVNLRNAIAYAIDVQEILDIYQEGYGTPCTSFWGPSQYGLYTDYEQPLEYNLELAKEYLAKSAYPNGVELELVALSNTENQTALIQAQLAKIGITVTINGVDSTGLGEICKSKDYDFFVYNKTCGPQGDQFRSILTYGNNTNRGHYNNARVMELLDLGLSEMDETKRLAYYKELQEITHEEMPYRPLYWGTRGYAWNKNASGMIFCGDLKNDYTFLVCTK